MKNNIYNALLFITILLSIGSCANEEMELNKGMNELVLTISDSTSILDVNNADASALKLEWTTGNNAGTGASISYVLEIAKAGSDFSAGISENLGKQVYSRTFSQQALSFMMVNELSCNPGEEVEIKARITAIVSDSMVNAQQSEVTFKTTPFIPVTETLYMVGDATPNGWNEGNATEMTKVSGTTGSFRWIGILQAGSFKFITTKGSFLPSYNKESDNTLVYRETGSDPDEKFTIVETGKYRLSVNVIKLTISIEKIEVKKPPYSNIYFVGSFNNWSFTAMTQDPVNLFIFRYGVVLNWAADGEFKFGTASGIWDNMYHPTVASAPYTHTSVTMDKTGDNKWVMKQSECGVAYKMALDITPEEEKFIMKKFIPYPGIWMIGDATSAGWSFDNVVAMNPGDDIYTFTWTGDLAAGGLKLTCDKKNDWMGAWFMASESDKEFLPVTEEVITFVDKSISGNGSVDRKWDVKTAGNYTITINQLTEKMTVVKN